MNDLTSLGRPSLGCPGLVLVLLLVAAGMTACGSETPKPSDAAGVEAPASHDDHVGHDHGQGPHGGAIAVIGNEVAHLEAQHDLDLGQVIVHILDTDNVVTPLDEPPVLNLRTDEGSVQVKAVKEGEGWLFEDDVLLDEPESARFRLVLQGKTYQPDMPCGDEHGHEHGAGCDHEASGHDAADHEAAGHGACGPHDGVLCAFDEGKAHLELKLHDDKGDLELWLYEDEEGETPFDVSLEAEIQVTFHGHDSRAVPLAVRDELLNEDEDGKSTLRGRKTNYFIFPGDTGADASWLIGSSFVSSVTVRITTPDGKTWKTETFELRPHTHGDGCNHE